MSYIPMPPRNTTAETLAQAISRYLKVECSKHFPLIQIGDTAEITSGGTPDTNNSAFWDGDIVWITPKDLGRPRTIEITNSERRITTSGASSSSAKLLPIGTVLLSSRAPIGHLGISHVPLATNQGFKNIICKNRLNNRFLFHMLRGSIPDLQSYGRGNTFAEIPSRIVKEYVIPLPPIELQKIIASFLDAVYHRLSGNYIPIPPLPVPLAEQQRIVAKIERLAGKIEEAKKTRQKSIEEAKSALNNEVRYIFTKLPNKSWAEGLLGDYILEDCYGTSEKTNDDPSGTPILRMGNIQNGILDTRDVKYLNINQKDRSKLILQQNDIVVNRTNSAELVGKCAVFNLKGDWGFASYLIRIRLDTNRANPWLVATYINSPLGRQYMFRERKQMTGQANVNSKKIRALPITLPSIQEQNCIVTYLEELRKTLDKVTAIQSQTTTELDALLPSILDRAFKGEL